MKLFLRFLGCQVALLAATCALPALANDSPGYVTIGELKTATSTPIVMQEEVGTFFVNPNGVVSSTIVFTFANPTGKSITVPTIFPFYGSGPGPDPVYYVDGDGGKLKVSINGRSVSYATGTGYFPVYSTNDERSADDGYSGQSSAGALFSVTVPANGTTKVAIDFVSPDHRGSPGIDFYYYFASGAGWSGSIGKATFKATYPYALEDGWWRASPTSTLSPDRKTITTVLTGFEPVDDGESSGISYWFLPPSTAAHLVAWRANPNNFATLARLYNDIHPAGDDAYASWLNYGTETIHSLGLDGIKDAYWNMRVSQTIDLAGADSCKQVTVSSSTDAFCLYLFAKTYSDDWSVDQYGRFSSMGSSAEFEKYDKVLSVLPDSNDDWIANAIRKSDKLWRGGSGNPSLDVAPEIKTQYVYVTTTERAVDGTTSDRSMKILIAVLSFALGALLSGIVVRLRVR